MMKRRLNFSLINKPIRDKELLSNDNNNQNSRKYSNINANNTDTDGSDDAIFRKRSVNIVNDKRQLYQHQQQQRKVLHYKQNKHSKSNSNSGDMLIID